MASVTVMNIMSALQLTQKGERPGSSHSMKRKVTWDDLAWCSHPQSLCSKSAQLFFASI